MDKRDELGEKDLSEAHSLTEAPDTGALALVCRWRMAGRRVPLLNRHVRALARRRVHGEPVSSGLLSWAKQHIEWSLAEDTSAPVDPDGVLMLLIDEAGRAAMTVGPYAPLADDAPAALVRRAEGAAREAELTGVAPELLARAASGVLTVGASAADALCGAADLAVQLARTRGLEVRFAGSVDAVVQETAGCPCCGPSAAPELFLLSDEHGVVPASGRAGEVAEFLARGYNTLCERARAQH